MKLAKFGSFAYFLVSLKLTRFLSFLLYFLRSIFLSTFFLFFEVQYTSPDSLFLSGINLSCDIVAINYQKTLKKANPYFFFGLALGALSFTIAFQCFLISSTTDLSCSASTPLALEYLAAIWSTTLL